MSEHLDENGEPTESDSGESGEAATDQAATDGADASQVQDDVGESSQVQDVGEGSQAEPDRAGSAPTDTDATGPEDTDGGSTQTPAPETGDLVIDAALRDLAEAPEDDLDAQVERGEQVQRTLQGRLSDLGG